MSSSNNAPCLLLGYWNNPNATRTAMRDGWFSVGDLAWRDEDGCYYVVDRKKDMNIYGGVADDYWGETGKALMVLHPGAELPEAEVIAACQEKLAGYKVPRRGRQLIARATQTQ